jgi:uncharacterized membrane protein
MRCGAFLSVLALSLVGISNAHSDDLYPRANQAAAPAQDANGNAQAAATTAKKGGAAETAKPAATTVILTVQPSSITPSTTVTSSSSASASASKEIPPKVLQANDQRSSSCSSYTCFNSGNWCRRSGIAALGLGVWFLEYKESTVSLTILITLLTV